MNIYQPFSWTAHAAVIIATACTVAPCFSESTDAGQGTAAAPVLETHPARLMDASLTSPINGATRAGDRIVTVGANGVILLSDNDGKSFRQAKSVPVRSTLNSVSFADDKRGWAAGHWGIVLGTEDGGETWNILRKDTEVDQPLFSIHFKSPSEGIAVGLWSLMLTTKDGGKTWEKVQLSNAPGRNKADLNLMHIFPGRNGEYFIAAEQGTVLKSTGDWQHWDYSPTGYKGTFWTGICLPSGRLLVAGLRGSLFSSNDGGHQWSQIDTGTKSSVTAIGSSGSKVMAVGLDGVTLESSDDAGSFVLKQRDDRLSLSAIVDRKGGNFSIFSRRGPIGPTGE